MQRLLRRWPSAAVCAFFLFCAGNAAAQTIPHVTGTFKTPEGKTPAQAGLKPIATIGAVAVYGTVDFQPYDSQGNKPARILCGGITYLPQRVRGWIQGDGTLVDNYTGAAGVDLVPEIGCTPAGLVMRAFATLAPSADGRIPSISWSEDKQIPQQASADWGSLAAAGVTAPSYIGYATVQDEGFSLVARAIINFTGAGVTCSDDALNSRTVCDMSAASGSFTAAGDLSGTSSSQTVIGIRGKSVSATAPLNGQILIYDGPSATYVPGDPIVSGPAAEGAAPANNPVWVSGKGADGFIHSIRTANDGTVRMDPTGTTTQPVSGTITANVGTTNGLALDATLTGGTQKTKLVDAGGTNVASISAAGAVKVDNSAVTQPVSGTVTANQGTAAAPSGAWPFATIDTANTVVKPGDATNNAVRVNVVAGGGAGGTSSSIGAAVPATGTAAGYNDGANMQLARVFDADTGAGTQYVLGAVLKKPASGGAVDFGTSTDPMHIACDSGCTAGSLFTDNSAFTAGTTAESNIGGVFNDALGAVTSGNAAAARITSSRALHVNLRNNSGTEIGTAGAALRVDPVGTTTQPVSGTVTANMGTTNGLALDATLTGGTQKTKLVDAGGANVASVSAAGALKVDNSGVTQPVSLAAAVDVSDRAARLVGQVEGRAASGAAKAGNPDQIGYVFNTTQPTVTTGQAVEAQGTARGAQIVATGVDPFAVNATETGTWTVQPGNTANTTPWLTTDSADGNTGSAVPAKASYLGGNGSGNLKGITGCDNWTPISLTANTQIIAGAASKQTYICSINLVAGAATNVAVVEGTGTSCATGTAGIFGGATAATGWNFAANGGIAQGSGLGAIGRTATAADNVCVLVSGANQISGGVSWTQF